jgi:hypothetical protein
MENVFADLPASEQKNIFSDLPQKEESGLWATAKNAGGSILGAAEAIGTNIINIPTAAVAGLQGIGATIGNLAGGGNFEGSMAQGAKAIEDYQATHGYVPETEWGKKYTGIVETPIQKVISEPSTQLGQIYTDITGSPAVGAVVKTIYEMAGMGILFGSPKMIAGLRAKGVPPELIKAGFEKAKMDNFKPTSEDVAVGKERIAGWKKTDEILARTPQRGRFVFEDLPTERPVEPTSKIYADTMGGKEAGMQGIIETLQKQGMPTERVNEIINRIYPDQGLDIVEGGKKVEAKVPTPEEIQASRTNQTLPEGQKAWDVTLPTAEETKGYGGVQNKPIETMTVPEITEKINFYNNLEKGEMSEANRVFISRTIGKLQDAYFNKTGKSITPESLPQSNILYKEYKGASPLETPPAEIAKGAQVNVMGGGPTFEASKGTTARTPSGKENPLPPNYSEKQPSTMPQVEQKGVEQGKGIGVSEGVTQEFIDAYRKKHPTNQLTQSVDPNFIIDHYSEEIGTLRNKASRIPKKTPEQIAEWNDLSKQIADLEALRIKTGGVRESVATPGETSGGIKTITEKDYHDAKRHQQGYEQYEQSRKQGIIVSQRSPLSPEEIKIIEAGDKIFEKATTRAVMEADGIFLTKKERKGKKATEVGKTLDELREEYPIFKNKTEAEMQAIVDGYRDKAQTVRDKMFSDLQKTKAGKATTLYSNPLPQALSGLQNVASSILRPILKLAEGETVKHGVIRKLQDAQRRILEYERTNQITPGKSTYKLEERTKSMIANALSEVDNIQKLWVNSVVGRSGKFDTGLKEVSDYVYAKFSQQRNATVEARRAKLIAEGKEVAGEYGSGMTNVEAQAILDKAKADGKTAKYEELAKPIWELGKSMRELMEKEGLIDAETAKAWEADGGPFYVTLQGGVEKPNVMPGSSGLRQGAGIKNYVGRKSMADDPITNMFRQYKNIVVRSMENNVKKSFGEIAANDPNITMNEWRSKMKYDSDTGMVRPVSEPPWMSTDPAIRENTVSFLKDGKQMYMTFKDDPLLARALNDVGVGQIGPILKASRAAIKLIGMTKTSLSPEFLITNAGCRDLLDAVHSIGVEMNLKTARKTLKTIPNGIASSYRAAKSRLDLSDPMSMDTSAKIFKENGGPTGYYSLRDFEGELKTMEQIASRAGEGAKPMALRSWDKVTDFVQDISESTENGVRLALFHELRMQGVPINEAISAAKNVTVNFNKMGEWGRHMKALYMFSNPAVQGAKRMIDLASTKRGAVVGAGIFGTGLALMELNRYNAGIDENGINNFDKLSQSEKTRNLILWPPGAKEPLKFPLGFYHRPYFGLASSIDSAINDPMKTTGGAALDVVNNMIDAFNPLGGGSVTSVVPTLIKPALEVATNYSWSGAPIHPELMPGETKARSEKYFQSATEASKGVASFLNAKTGGDKFESGDISISPNTIDYVSNFFLGDPAVTMARLTDMAAKYYKGESIETPKIPIVRRFAGASTDYALPKWFNEAAAVNKPQYAREKEIFDQADIAEDNRAYTPKAEMGKLATRFSREYGELNKLYKEVKDTDISKMEGITRDRKAEVMTDLKKQMQDLLGAYVKTHIELKKQPMQKEMQ